MCARAKDEKMMMEAFSRDDLVKQWKPRSNNMLELSYHYKLDYLVLQLADLVQQISNSPPHSLPAIAF